MAKTILIIEDDPAIRQGLALNLQFEGYRVLLAADGREGLDLWAREAPDLLMVDLMLPRLIGMDVIREVRAKDQEVSLIVLSARDQEADKVLALSLGADDYITKPFGLAELSARVRAALRRHKPSANKRAQEESRVRIDVAARRVFVEERVVETTALEFDLLRFFSQYPGQVFSREQLLDRIWGRNATLRTVDNFIARLRGKIEVNVESPVHLETVRGVGYRFNP